MAPLFKPSVAMCCGTPCVSTFKFYKNEWFCVKCRRPLPFMRPAWVDPSEELNAEKERNQVWFAQAKNLAESRLLNPQDDCDIEMESAG